MAQYRLTREIIIDGVREPRGTVIDDSRFSPGAMLSGVEAGYLIPADQPMPETAPLTSLELMAGVQMEAPA